jgi:hypothetical protein
MKLYTTESAPIEEPKPTEVVAQVEAEHVDVPVEAAAVENASDEDAPLTGHGEGQFVDIVEEI